MNILIYVLFMIGGVIASTVFAVCGLFFLAGAFAQCSEVWECRRAQPLHLDEMVTEISRQALQLDEVRLDMFLQWLQNHCPGMQIQSSCHSQPTCPSNIRHDLETNIRQWLEAFPLSGQLWEYHLVLTEITWWHDLDCARLTKIARDYLGNES